MSSYTDSINALVADNFRLEAENRQLRESLRRADSISIAYRTVATKLDAQLNAAQAIIATLRIVARNRARQHDAHLGAVTEASFHGGER